MSHSQWARFFRFLVSSFCLVTSACVSDGEKQENADKKYTREDFYIESSFPVSELSADGQTVYTAYYNAQLWSYDFRIQKSQILLQFDKVIKSFSTRDYISSIIRSNDGQFLYLGVEQQPKNADKSNHEFYKFNIKTKQVEKIFEGESFGWKVCSISPDGTKMSFNVRPKDRYASALFVLDLKDVANGGSRKPIEIVPAESILDCGVFTADNLNYDFEKYITNSTSEIVRVNLKSKELKVISEKGKHIFYPVSYSEKNPQQLAISNSKSDFFNIYAFDSEKKVWTQKTFETWDIEQFFYLSENKLFFAIINQDGFSKLKIYKENFQFIQDVSIDLDRFSIEGIDDSEQNLLLRAYKSPLPPELFLYNWKTGKVAQITNFNKLQIPTSAFKKL